MEAQQGTIIFFDGPDGVGKTTQLNMVAEKLRSEEHRVYTTRVHGGTPFGEKLRDVSLSDTPRQPITDLYLSRTMHAELAHDLHERRNSGEICLVDRSPAAMWSYQVRAGGLDESLARPVIEEDFRWFNADLLLVYIASLHILKQRITDRNEKHDYFEDQADQYHEWTLIGYTEAEKLFGATIIDASMSQSDVHHATMQQIRKIIPAPKQ